MTSTVVAKFGGTSMGDAEAMKKSAEIVCSNSKIKLVVVSATSGTTNQLLRIFEYATSDKTPDLKSEIESILNRHTSIANLLECHENDFFHDLYLEIEQISTHLREVASEKDDRLQAQLLDQLLSIGERLSSVLFVSALRKQGIQSCYFDARKVLITDSHFGKAEPDIDTIASNCKTHLLPLFDSCSVIVTQGFIGSTSSGQTTTLGRGGSDYSAALFAEGVEAKELQIWTDVAGIMTMDPNAVTKAKVISKLSFDEAAELANFGAKVLHPATLWPAIRKKIQVFVGSTFRPTEGGTWIHPEPDETPCVRAIALRKNQTLITVTSLRMLNTHGFLAKLFGILAHYHLSVDLVTTSEVSVALTIDQASLGSSGKRITHYSDLFRDLREFCDVKIEENLTLIALIGNGLSTTPGLSSKTFNSISQFNIRLICHGASSHNLCFLVKQEEALAVANRLHQEWIVGGTF